MRRFLVILRPDGSGDQARFEVESHPLLVGRSAEAAVWLDDPLASRRHLEVRLVQDAVRVRNLSPKGFRLNNRPCAGEDSVEIEPGSVLGVGQTRIQLRVESAPTETAAPAAPPLECPKGPAAPGPQEAPQARSRVTSVGRAAPRAPSKEGSRPQLTSTFEVRPSDEPANPTAAPRASEPSGNGSDAEPGKSLPVCPNPPKGEAADAKIDAELPFAPESDGETRAADPEVLADLGIAPRDAARPQDDPSDRTHAIADGDTPLLDSEELPSWRPPATAGRSWRSRLFAGVALSAILVAGGLWFNSRGHSADGVPLEFRSPLHGGYSLTLPAGWTQIEAGADTNVFGFMDAAGRGGTGPTVRIAAEKRPGIALAGLPLGFRRYQSAAAERLPGFRITASERFNLGDRLVLRFAFTANSTEGEGFVLVDGDSQIVVETFGALGTFGRYKSMVREIQMTFKVLSGEAQEVVDFPLPDEESKELAMSKPHQAILKIQELVRYGDDLVANWTVRREYLHQAIQAYRQAIQLQLAVSGQSGTEAFNAQSQKLATACRQYRRVIANLEFEILLARKKGLPEVAKARALELAQTVVDKGDPAYQKALRLAR